MDQHDLNENIGFEQVDADAVCENCGTVNPDQTLLCKACGNNLRDQRARRIANDDGVDALGNGVSRVRIFTGVLTVLGIFVVLLTAYSMPNIESWLISVQETDGGTAAADLWSGKEGAILDKLYEDLQQSPSTARQREDALENPVNDSSYNGRYVLARPGADGQGNIVIGEANLSRRNSKVYFVAKTLLGSADIRGYAMLEGEEMRPTARNSAGVQVNGRTYSALGYAEKRADGSHACYARSSYNDNRFFVLAYRVR